MIVPTRTAPAPSDRDAAASRTPLRRVFTPAAVSRMLLGWLAVAILALLGPLLGTPLLIAGLVGTIAVIVVCAFGVVHQAERLAARLGDPFGTLALTLSIVLIEVVLIVAIMLGPGEHTTIARDSVLAMSMIILNLVIGVALLVGGIRHGGLRHNRTGTSHYLGMLVVLVAVAFGMPQLIGDGGSFTVPQAVAVIAVTVVLYGFFLWRQTGAQATDFTEVRAAGAQHPLSRAAVRAHSRELGGRFTLLALTMLPIVLLSHDLAAMLDRALALVQAPPALSGILIAAIVFLPEAITAVRAANAGEIQRVSNLCHGALVSTVGLTVPAVLAVGLVTGAHPVFALDPVMALLLAVSVVLSIATFAARRVTAVHGSAHLAVFALYAIAVFA
nr:calcium:proton antiporter [Microbacterium bovistercoris]